MADADESRGIWLAPDWSGLAIEAEDGSLVELGREHGYGAWVSQGMLDVVPDHWVRLVPLPDSETEWGVRVYGLEPEETGTEAWARAVAETHEGYVAVQRRAPGPWTEVQP